MSRSREHIWPDGPPPRLVRPVTDRAIGIGKLLEHVSDADRRHLSLLEQAFTTGDEAGFHRHLRRIDSGPLRLWCCDEYRARLGQFDN